MPQWSWAFFPHGSDDKESTHNAGDSGLIPGSGRSPGEGNGYPLQYSCLGNPTDRRAWRATDHGVAKSQTWLCEFHFHFQWNQLLAFIYCMHIVAIREKFAFYETILEPGKDVNVFKMVKNCFARESFHWKTNLGVLCTGGAPAMFGNTSGLAAFLKKATPCVMMTHCLLYRQAMTWDSASNSAKVFLHCHGKINLTRAKGLNRSFWHGLSKGERGILTSLLHVPRVKLEVLDCILGKFYLYRFPPLSLLSFFVNYFLEGNRWKINYIKGNSLGNTGQGGVDPYVD